MGDHIRKLQMMAIAVYDKACASAHKLCTDTRFEYWALHPRGQFVIICLAIAVISLIWAFSLGFLEDVKESLVWIRGKKGKTGPDIFASHGDPDVKLEEHEQIDDHGDSADWQIPIQPLHEELPETPRPSFMQLSSPPSSFKTAQPRGTFNSAVHSTNLQPTKKIYPVEQLRTGEHRTGRPSTPGYQTPFAAKKKASLVKEGLFNADATRTKRSGEKTKRSYEDLVDSLVMDEGKRVELRKQALNRLKVKTESP